jgi:histidinol-phosphate aminotransferase
MKSLLTPNPGIMDIALYVGGESKTGAARTIKLSSNESAFGPSPKAMKALAAMAPEMHRYPDGNCSALRAALAEKNNIDAGHIVCGAGSDEIIAFLRQAYISPGDEVLYNRHGFLMYGISAQVAGGVPVLAPEKNLTADVDALLAAVTDKTKILFLANPNNPTGSYLPKNEIRRLRENLRENVLLVLDAAYAEYVTADDYSAGHEMVDECDNVVVMRTFSKIYGMGGLRVGWGHCPPAIADVLNRVRGPFNVSAPAQIAAVAALDDDGFVARAVAHNAACLKTTTDRLRSLGLTVYPSAGNFILVDFDTADRAEAARLFMKDAGILVRQMGAYGLPSCLRITIGTDEEMALACAAITGYLQ